MREEAVVTPAPAEDQPGQSVVFVDSFPTADGCATVVPTSFRPGAERTDGEYPFVLTTGRVLEHWHTGAMTRHASMLDAIAPEALVSLHPLDAAAQGVADGTMVKLQTHHGEVVARASVSDQVRRGQLFIPFAFWEAAANTLTGDALDAVAKIPGFKVTAARLLPA
jgi:formate dehydrogenase major subunit